MICLRGKDIRLSIIDFFMISVIVPVYNVENYLSRCLDSIVSQTYNNLEIILVDDGSSDGSGRLCDEYVHKDDRIKVIHQENSGVSKARNSGLRVASGEYILFTDGDDVMHPRMIETLYYLIISGDYDFSMCYGKNVYSVPEIFVASIDDSKLFYLSGNDCMKNMFVSKIDRRQYVWVWNKLYRRKLIQLLEFSDTPTEDLYFNCLVYLKVRKAIVIPQTLYFYIQRSSSITHQGIDERWVKDLDSMKMCLDAIPTDNRMYRSYCLSGIYKRILSTRLWSKGTTYYKIAMDGIHFVKKQTIREYLLDSYIPIIEKSIFLLFLRVGTFAT